MTRFFRDRRGRVVLAQMPNLPLVVWFVSMLTERVAAGTLEDLAGLITFGAIFTWSWMELFQGVTGFRRLLGAIVLVWAVWGRL